MTGDPAISTPTVPLPSGGRAGNGASGSRPIFLMAVVIAVAVHAGALFIFRVGPATTPAQAAPRPHIFYALEDKSGVPSLVEQQAKLNDLEPIFLPTSRNYATGANALPRPPGPLLFQPYTSNVTPAEADFRPPNEALAAAGGPAQILQIGHWDFLGTFGTDAAPAKKLAPRGAHLTVTRLGPGLTSATAGPAGVKVIDEDWPVDLRPPAGEARWAPAHFLLLFTEAGPVGQPLLQPPPQLEAADDVEAVDDFLRARLDERFRRRPLPAGAYEAVIGP